MRNTRAPSPDDVRALVRGALPEKMGERPGAVLYCGTDALRPSRVYLMGLNPGGHPDENKIALVDTIPVTRVAPSSMATSKSSLIPMEKYLQARRVAHRRAHRSPSRTSLRVINMRWRSPWCGAGQQAMRFCQGLPFPAVRAVCCASPATVAWTRTGRSAGACW